MNRGDTRLFLTIISTAFVTAVVTLIISRMVTARDAQSEAALRHEIAELDQELVTLQQRLHDLEHPPAPPPPPPPLPVAVPAEAPDPVPCDEVACVLNNYEGQCCAKFKKAPITHHDGTPDSLDRQMISDGVALVKPDVLACADGVARGQVKVHVKVAPDGVPASVTITVSPTPELGACVARVMRTARFGHTAAGGSFSYPFVF